jgi:hypothetical protein
VADSCVEEGSWTSPRRRLRRQSLSTKVAAQNSGLLGKTLADLRPRRTAKYALQQGGKNGRCFTGENGAVALVQTAGSAKGKTGDRRHERYGLQVGSNEPGTRVIAGSRTQASCSRVKGGGRTLPSTRRQGKPGWARDPS